MLSVQKKGDDGAVIFQNFVINTETMLDQHEYEIKGSQKKFDNFSELLNYYERYPVSAEINCIGCPLLDWSPPSPRISGLLVPPEINLPRSPSPSPSVSSFKYFTDDDGMLKRHVQKVVLV